jgi:site-specific recombinase XerD
MAVDILKRYESYLNEKKFCSSTIKTYKNHFQHFKNFLDKNNLDMHQKNVRKYLLYLFKEKHYSNIKSQKMQVFISSPQNKNNRYVLLSHKLLKSLREYYKIYKPKYWLFENSNGQKFPKRTFQKSFQQAVKISGINKRATLTILKNSFAVHLLEKGIDLRFVQEILGHKSSKTTMKYLKTCKRDLNSVQSPLDNLDI